MDGAFKKKFSMISSTKLTMKFAITLFLYGEICNAFSYILEIIKIFLNTHKYTDDFPNIVISGYGRTGKSLLANKLAQKYRYKIIETDIFRSFYWKIPDIRLRKKLRESLFLAFLDSFPVSVIIEGDDLVSENRHANSGIEPLSIDFMVQLYNSNKAKCFILGDSESNIDSKIEGILRWRSTENGRTNDYSFKEMYEHANESIEVSKKLKTMVNGTPIHYIELNPSRFTESVDNAIMYISDIAGLNEF